MASQFLPYISIYCKADLHSQINKYELAKAKVEAAEKPLSEKLHLEGLTEEVVSPTDSSKELKAVIEACQGEEKILKEMLLPWLEATFFATNLEDLSILYYFCVFYGWSCHFSLLGAPKDDGPAAFLLKFGCVAPARDTTARIFYQLTSKPNGSFEVQQSLEVKRPASATAPGGSSYGVPPPRPSPPPPCPPYADFGFFGCD